MTEGAPCHCTFMYGISVIVGHFSLYFASVNNYYYSLRRLRISNNKYPRNLHGNAGYGPERLIFYSSNILLLRRSPPLLRVGQTAWVRCSWNLRARTSTGHGCSALALAHLRWPRVTRVWRVQRTTPSMTRGRSWYNTKRWLGAQDQDLAMPRL